MAFPTLDDTSLVEATDVPSPIGGRAVQNVHVAKALTTAMLADGYVTALLKMPANTRYVDLYLDATDMDTGVSPALQMNVGIRGIGDTAYDDANALVNGSGIAQSGSNTDVLAAAGRGLHVPIEHYVVLEIETAAATAAAGTLTLGLQVEMGTPT